MHTHAKLLEKFQARSREPLRQGRQDAIGRLDEMDFDVLFGIDAIEAVGYELARRIMQLRRKLGTGRTRPDDGDLKLLRAQRLGLRVAANIGIHQSGVKTLGLDRRIERDCMLAHSRGAEIVTFAADGDDQRIVAKTAPRRDLMALLVDVRRERDFAALPIEPGHLADTVTKAMPVRLRQEIDLVHGEIHAPGGDLMQQWFP
jgi:hypothetical protein